MRKEFGARIKAAALKRCMDDKGIYRCEGELPWGRCNVELRGGNTFYDHHQPDGLGGAPTLENARVLCGTCHSHKTFNEDNPRMQKADRSKKAHYGIKPKQSRPIPGTRASGFKKRMDGTVERRS